MTEGERERKEEEGISMVSYSSIENDNVSYIK
jgi:hypothetical protein